MTYCGQIDRPGDRLLLPDLIPRQSKFVAHRFQRDGKEEWIVYLPRTASIKVKVDQKVLGGEVWANALSQSPRREPRCGADLADACGGEPALIYLEWLWLRHQVIDNPDRPDEALLPAELACLAAQDVPPVDLYWDLVPCERYVNAEAEAVLLPPLPLDDWSRVRWVLPGEVDMNAAAFMSVTCCPSLFGRCRHASV
jgi:hypothetical protein